MPVLALALRLLQDDHRSDASEQEVEVVEEVVPSGEGIMATDGEGYFGYGYGVVEPDGSVLYEDTNFYGNFMVALFVCSCVVSMMFCVRKKSMGRLRPSLWSTDSDNDSTIESDEMSAMTGMSRSSVSLAQDNVPIVAAKLVQGTVVQVEPIVGQHSDML